MKILVYPNNKLRIKADPVEDIDEDLLALIDTMFGIMSERSALGLAATQLGVPKRLFVYSDQTVPKVIINPEIKVETGSTTTDLESCLSIMGYTDRVMRANYITVKGISKHGVESTVHAYGLLSRIIQHENDHLDGVLFIDKSSPMKRDMYKRKLKKWMNKQ